MPTRRTAGKRTAAAHATKERPEPYEEEDLAEDEAYENDDETHEAEDEDEFDEGEPDEGEPAGFQHASPERRGSAHGQVRGMSATAAAQIAMRQIVGLTGKQPQGVTSIERTDDGWVVGVELVEDRRIPSTSDILAVYEVGIDIDGNLVSYRRTNRYARGRGDGSERS